MEKYDLVYDETIVSYLELYCFLGAYYEYLVASDTGRRRAAREVAQYCTASYIQRVTTQIDTLLTTQSDDQTLLTWLNHIADGWTYESASEARHNLRELQKLLQNELQKQRAPQQLPATASVG